VCFANKRKFYDELRSPTPDLGDVKKVIEEDYDCNQHTEWQPGYTPKDLLDMKLMEDQRAWQAKKDTADKRWRVLELVVMGGLVTMATILTTLASAFIERGSLFPAPQQPAAPPVVRLVMPQQPAPPDVEH
jgi:hypothetical protein